MQFGYEALKLVSRASEMVDEPEWFEVISQVIAALDVASIDIRLIQTWFYIRYAELLGHGLGLQYDVDGALLLVDMQYRYDVGEKGLRQATGGEITAQHITLLRLIATKPLERLVQIGGTQDVIADCLLVARQHAAI